MSHSCYCHSLFILFCELLHYALSVSLTLNTFSFEDECPSPRFRSDYELLEGAEGWLKLHRVPATWSDARLRCHAEGGQLASPLSPALQRALAEFLHRRAPAVPLVYCGVHATYSAGDYASIEGVPLRSLALQWAEGQPDNRHDAERCVALQPRHNGTARDVPCARALPYLCYKHLDAEMPPVNECGTTDPGGQLASPLSPALQRALAEFLHRRAPAVPLVYCGVHATYSAGDYASIEGVPLRSLALQWAEGQPDNRHDAERCVALQPRHNGTARDVPCARALPYLCYKHLDAEMPPVNECGTTDPEYMLSVMTNTCYKFHRRGLSWARAYLTCAAEGGALAVPNGALEAALLRDLFSKNPDHTIDSPFTSYALVGIRDNNDGGSWMTIHGETLQQAGFRQWAEAEPDHQAAGDEQCGGLHRDGGLLAVPCALHRYAFICEKSPTALTEPDELCMPNRR